MSVVRLIVATWSSNILISGKIINEMPGSVASGTLCIFAVGLYSVLIFERYTVMLGRAVA